MNKLSVSFLESTPSPPQGPKLSVIVSTYNRTWNSIALTQKCLQSLMATCDPGTVEIILTDDASPEWNPFDWYGPPIKINRNPTNLGYGANNNRGAVLSTTPLLLLLNSDTEARQGWVEGLLSAHARHPNAILGARLLFPSTDGVERIQSVGGLYDAQKHPFHRFLGFQASHKGTQDEEEVSWVTGAALAIPKALWATLGGFDEAYGRGYFEDTDLCERAKRMGAEIWYVPSATFIHVVAQSTAVDNLDAGMKAARSFAHNKALFHQRHDRYIEPDIGSVLSPGT